MPSRLRMRWGQHRPAAPLAGPGTAGQGRAASGAASRVGGFFSPRDAGGLCHDRSDRLAKGRTSTFQTESAPVTSARSRRTRRAPSCPVVTGRDRAVTGPCPFVPRRVQSGPVESRRDGGVQSRRAGCSPLRCASAMSCVQMAWHLHAHVLPLFRTGQGHEYLIIVRWALPQSSWAGLSV